MDDTVASILMSYGSKTDILMESVRNRANLLITIINETVHRHGVAIFL